MEEKKSTKGCSPPKKGGAARTGPLWECSDTSQHFTPTPFLVGAGAITSSHRLLLMIIDNYQHYHTNGKMGAWLLQSTAHVAVHRATSLSLSLLSACSHAPAGLSLVCVFGEGCHILEGEKEPERPVPLCCITALPKSITRHRIQPLLPLPQ